MFNINEADRRLIEQIRRGFQGDFYRLVDIETHAVYDYKDGVLLPSGTLCHNIWKRGAACKNCSSRVAMESSQSIIKLETVDNRVYLVISMPVDVGEKKMAMEVMRDVTDSLIAEDLSPDSKTIVADLIGKLNQAAMEDPYTGLYNKRYAEIELAKAVEDWDVHLPLTAVVLDIDSFKTYNDTYGHLQGDEVISGLAGMLKESAAQGNGWAGRMGGDEFLLVFQGKNREEAEKLLDGLDRNITEHPFGRGIRFHVSVSMGMEQFEPWMKDWETFLDRADQNMYINKRKKRAAGQKRD